MAPLLQKTSFRLLCSPFRIYCIHKASCIIKDPSHPSHNLSIPLPSGRGFHSPPARRARQRNSVYPQVVKLLKSVTFQRTTFLAKRWSFHSPLYCTFTFLFPSPVLSGRALKGLRTLHQAPLGTLYELCNVSCMLTVYKNTYYNYSILVLSILQFLSLLFYLGAYLLVLRRTLFHRVKFRFT